MGQDLLDKIYNQLDNKEKILFLSIVPRIVDTQNLYNWLKKDFTAFSIFIKTKPPASISMPTHHELFDLLVIFHDFYKNKSDYDEKLYNFALSRSKVLKRLEAQTILKGFVERSVKDKSRFEMFYNKVEEKDYFLSDIKIINLNISKNAFYNSMNPGNNPLDKQTVTSFLINFVEYLNSQEKNRLMFNKIYILNTDYSVSYYTIIIDVKKDSSINYEELIYFVLDNSKSMIGKREIQEVYKAAISNYFLCIKLPLKNTQEVLKNNKI